MYLEPIQGKCLIRVTRRSEKRRRMEKPQGETADPAAAVVAPPAEAGGQGEGLPTKKISTDEDAAPKVYPVSAREERPATRVSTRVRARL